MSKLNTLQMLTFLVPVRLVLKFATSRIGNDAPKFISRTIQLIQKRQQNCPVHNLTTKLSLYLIGIGSRKYFLVYPDLATIISRFSYNWNWM